MRAIILVAGEGTRLHPHTLDRPKCLVRLAGRPLLDWQIDALRKAGVRDVTLVTGHKADALAPAGLPAIHNPRYRDTNMVASLFCARSLLDGADDVIISYGDIAYEPRVIDALAASPAPIAITVNRDWLALWRQRMADPLADAETLRIDAAGHVIELGRKPRTLADVEAQYMGLIGIKAGFASRLVDAYDALDPTGPYDGRDRDRMFMTSFLQHVIDRVSPVAAVPCDGGWLEIDTLDDLSAYESLHATGRLAQFCDLKTVAGESPGRR